MSVIKIKKAKLEQHKDILAIANTHFATKSFGNPAYSGPDVYQKGRIYVALAGETVVGFVAYNHCIRKPHSSIYFMGVHPDWRRKGIAKHLVQKVLKTSPWGTIKLLVDRRNIEAMAFYVSLGFEKYEEDKAGIRMQCRIKEVEAVTT